MALMVLHNAQDGSYAKHRLSLLLGCGLSFLIAALLTEAITGQRLNLFLDEGIYLYGAQRTSEGQIVYRDWLLFTGPGTDWLYAVVFLLFGKSLVAAHAFLAIEIGLISAATYWIVSAKTNWIVALGASICFMALLTAFPHRFYVNHRWDSLCFALVGVAVIAKRIESTTGLIVSGLFLSFAAIITPPSALIAFVTLIYLLRSSSKKAVGLFITACVFPFLFCVGVLASQHALHPMLQSFQWAASYYQNANRVSFGYEPTDPTIQSDQTESLIHRGLIAIPAALVLVSAGLFCTCLKRRVPVSSLAKWVFAAGVGAVLSSFPRWAANQLLFAAPFLLAASFLMTAALLSAKRFRLLSFVQLAVCSLPIFLALTEVQSAVPVSTQLGEVICRQQDQKSIEFATAVVKPGESLFVFPYQPIWYSLTGGVNPTYYDFLQPGMMTSEDESRALRDLEAHPPDWIIWHSLPVKTILAIWPHSNPASLTFPRIEQFIRSRYRQVRPPDPTARYLIAVFGRS